MTMSKTYDAMVFREHFDPTPKDIEKIQRRLDEHRALPFPRRILRRMVLNYPSSADMWKLEKHEMGGYGWFRYALDDKTFGPSYFKYAFLTGGMNGEPNAYTKMVQESKWVRLTGTIDIRSDWLARRLVEELADFRPEEGERINEPRYAGAYRRIVPKSSESPKRKEDGIFLMDAMGVQVEMIKLDQEAVDSLDPELLPILGDFADALPYPRGVQPVSTLGTVP